MISAIISRIIGRKNLRVIVFDGFSGSDKLQMRNRRNVQGNV